MPGNGRKILDVTRTLSPYTVAYAGDTVPDFRQEDAGVYLVSSLLMSSHSGTHIDAPVHYLKTGMTVDEIPPASIIGKCRVIDLSAVPGKISRKDLEGKIGGVSRILIRTRFSGMNEFAEDYPCLDLGAAKLLTESGIRCVGIDSLSIEEFQCDGSVHRELMRTGCIIIELLDLSQVSPGEYTLVALPLKLKGMDGSPARVVLIREGCDDND